MHRRAVIFVGSFGSPKDGTEGGQAVACRLLKNSRLSDHVEWHLIDSTQLSQPPPGFLVRSWGAARRLARLLPLLPRRSVETLLVFSSYGGPSLAEKGLMCILGRAAGKRVVLSLRSEVKPQPSDWLLGWYWRLAFKCCHLVVCQTEFAAENLRRILKRNIPTIVIPNWVDVDHHRRPPQKPKEPGVVTFLFCGWLERFKGVYELLEAARILKAGGVRFRILLCGGGGERPRLEARTEELELQDCVSFRGWVKGREKLEIFWQSDIFVLPSYSEGLPNSVVEAMASGLAVVATNVGGIPALVEHEVNGLLVRPKSVGDLGEAMKRLALDPELVRRMARANEATVARRHDIKRLWPRVAEVLSTGALVWQACRAMFD